MGNEINSGGAPASLKPAPARKPPREGSIFSLNHLVSSALGRAPCDWEAGRSGHFHLAQKKRALRGPGIEDVRETYNELVKPLNDDASNVPPAKSEPILVNSCWNEGRKSSLTAHHRDGAERRQRVALFRSSRDYALTNAQLRFRVSKAATTRERRVLRDQTSDWSALDWEELDASLAVDRSGGAGCFKDMQRIADAWEIYFPVWFDGVLEALVREGIEAVKKERPKRGRVLRINGERKWVKRRGRPRTPLRPSRYKPRRREVYAGDAVAVNFAADGEASERPANTADID